MHRDFKGIWIPAFVWLNKDLTVMQKFFISEISSLDTGAGCWAGLSHFMEVFTLSKSRCSEVITSLCDGGFVVVSFEDNGRGGERRVLRLDPMFGKPNGGSENRTKGSENRTRGSENRTPIYDEKYNEKYIEITTTTRSGIEKLKFTQADAVNEIIKNDVFIESVMLNNKLKNKDTLTSAASRFVQFQIGVGKVYNNMGDFLTHFSSWVKSQGLVDVTMSDDDMEASVEWFIEVFNKLSRKQYVSTRKIKELFAVQVSQGFTGEQMKTAIENLYSSKNTWHKKNNFVEATPEFLLTSDRLNKYLNANY